MQGAGVRKNKKQIEERGIYVLAPSRMRYMFGGGGGVNPLAGGTGRDIIFRFRWMWIAAEIRSRG